MKLEEGGHTFTSKGAILGLASYAIIVGLIALTFI